MSQKGKLTRLEAQKLALAEIRIKTDIVRKDFDQRIALAEKPTEQFKLVKQRDIKLEKIADKIASKYETQIMPRSSSGLGY